MRLIPRTAACGTNSLVGGAPFEQIWTDFVVPGGAGIEGMGWVVLPAGETVKSRSRVASGRSNGLGSMVFLLIISEECLAIEELASSTSKSWCAWLLRGWGGGNKSPKDRGAVFRQMTGKKRSQSRSSFRRRERAPNHDDFSILINPTHDIRPGLRNGTKNGTH